MAIKSKDEQRWQAESDAHTMAAYQEIINDKARMQRAVKAAREQARDLTRRASAMQSAANVKAKSNGRRK